MGREMPDLGPEESPPLTLDLAGGSRAFTKPPIAGSFVFLGITLGMMLTRLDASRFFLGWTVTLCNGILWFTGPGYIKVKWSTWP